MHLIVSFAAPLAEGCRAALPSLLTPGLDRLLARWAPTRRDLGDEDTLSLPHERALAAACGLAAPDGSFSLVVAVADFENGTGDREMDGLSGLLTTSLEQSRRIRVLPRWKLVSLLAKIGEPSTAPKWSAPRWKPKARPRSSDGVTSAMRASRGGVRIPFPTRSTTRNPITCHAAEAAEMSGRISTAVA